MADIYLLAKGGGLIIPPEVTARLAPPRRGRRRAAGRAGRRRAGPLRCPAMTVPFPGRWTLELSVRTRDIDEESIDAAGARSDEARCSRCSSLLLSPAARARARDRAARELAARGDGRLTFRVPNERDDAATVQARHLPPAGRARRGHRAKGWTQVVLDTGEVRWTADEGSAINPGRTRGLQGPARPAPGRAADRLQGAAALRRRAGRALDPGPDGRASGPRRCSTSAARRDADRRHRTRRAVDQPAGRRGRIVAVVAFCAGSASSCAGA